MSFKNKTFSFTVFQVNNPSAITSELLKKYAFQPIDSQPTEEISKGWTSFDDLNDFTWSHSIPDNGEFMFFSLRIDSRTVSSALLNRHLKEALQDKKIKRTMRKSMKESIKKDLITKIPPVPKVIDLILDTSNSLLYVESTSNKILKTIGELLEQHFKVKIQEMYFAGLESRESSLVTAKAIPGFFKEIYENSPSVSMDNRVFRFAEAESAEFIKGTKKIQVKCEPQGMTAGFNAGLEITKLKISINSDLGEFFLTLDSKLRFSGFKTPKIEKPKKSSKEEDDASILIQVYHFTQIVQAVHSLFKEQWD